MDNKTVPNRLQGRWRACAVKVQVLIRGDLQCVSVSRACPKGGTTRGNSGVVLAEVSISRSTDLPSPMEAGRAYADDVLVFTKSEAAAKRVYESIGVSIQARLVELRRYLQGWVGYFRLVPLKSFYDELDKWIRRRLRACFWRQWRRPSTRVRNLLQLGVPRAEALTHGSSSKGPWVMSSSRAAHMALSIEYLKRIGVASLLEIWIKLASKGRTA